MWNDFSIRYIRKNRVSSVLLAGAAFLTSLLLSLLCSIAYNLWEDYVKQQQAAAQAVKTSPEALFILYGIVLLLVCTALIVLLHHAFAVSMGSRLHQMGILKSVGATPEQIRNILLQEVLVLCTLPILAGTGVGIGLCAVFIRRIISMEKEMGINIEYGVAFEYHIFVFLISIGAAFLTVLFSAWIPAKKLGRLSPMEAIFGKEDPKRKKVGTFRLTSKCFGVYGELAGKSLYVRRKSMKTAVVALFLAFLGFFLFLSGETISGLSTQHTYFARFRNTWDYMLTVKKESKDDKKKTLLTKLRELPGMESCIAYELVDAMVTVPEQVLDDALLEIGPQILLEGAKQVKISGQIAWQIKAHFYILDDQSFQEYCKSGSISSDAGIVVVNLLWDDRNSDYTNRTYLPFLKENAGTLQVKETSLQYDAFADVIPDIREELKQKVLNLVISEKAFSNISSLFSADEVCYNMRTTENLSEKQSDMMEASIERLVSEDLESKEKELEKARFENAESSMTEGSYILENRLEEERADALARKGLRIVMGVLAGILACVGITGILTTTLGQLYQRKKEFARYLSVGVSLNDIRKMLFMEAMFIVGRPFLLALFIDIPVTALLLRFAPVTAGEFLRHLPWMPVFLLLAVTVVIVALSYVAASRKICRQNIVEILKDDALV